MAPRRPERPWQRCDPRARLLATAAISGSLLAATSWSGVGAGLAAVAAAHVAAGDGVGKALSALRPFRLLLLFTLVVQAGFTPGTPALPGVLPAAVTVEGCSAAAGALLRLGGVIAVSALLVRTTSPLELARSVGWALAPSARAGVPVREATLVLALGFHLFPLLHAEGRQVRAALESRGISLRDPRLALRARAVTVWLLAVLFGLIDRSERLATALEARGYALPSAQHPRFHPWRIESTALVAAALGAAALVVFRS